jgi:mannose-6-phosphate isomerase
MNHLYPLKFKPIIKDKIWGGSRLRQVLHKKCKTDKAGESWEISGFPGSISKVSNGFLAGNSLEELIEIYMGDLVGDSVFEEFGTLFPLLIKFIDANDVLSVQVHPGDELARKQFGSFGKTEMWYIVESEENAEIIVGFEQSVTPEIYLRHLQEKSLLSILHKEKARPGDVFFLPAGRIHAIGPGILLAEIQQTSDATLRIYDFDRLDDQGKPRELHTEKALEAMDFKLYPSYRNEYTKTMNQANQLASCRYFTTNYLPVNNTINKEYHHLDSFIIYMCIDGKVQISGKMAQPESLSKGETLLIPAEMKNVQIEPAIDGCKLLEVYVDRASENARLESLLDQLL